MVMEQSNLAKIFKALSSEQRLKLFMMLHEKREKTLSLDPEKQCCMGHIKKAFSMACEHFSISRSTISHHLKELQNAGLVKCTRNGQSFDCEINEEAIKSIQNFLK
jgi:ArsR family transcriptional regulator